MISAYHKIRQMIKKNKPAYIFPLFNTVIGAMFGGVIGYYIFRPGLGVLLGGLAGLLLGLAVEWALGRLGSHHWLYRRRVLLTVLVEVPVAVFVLGPYAYVLSMTLPDHHPVCCETPLDFGASAYEDVRIRTSGGVTLAGWYVPPQQTPGPVIVLLHGSRSDRRGAIWHAAELVRAGYGVLLYDSRALGESTGESTTYALAEYEDLLDVVTYLEGRPEVAGGRIGAVGLSLGGHIALNAAYYAPDRLPALWLDGIQAQRLEDFPAPENVGERFASLMNVLILRALELHLGRPVPPAHLEILAALDGPQLVIVQSGLDPFESRVAQKYAAVVRDNAEVWLIPDAWHVGGPVVIPAEYSRRMVAFFDAVLRP